MTCDQNWKTMRHNEASCQLPDNKTKLFGSTLRKLQA